MKAILWKELRENLRWAVLGCLVLTLAEFYIFAGLPKDSGNSSSLDMTLTDPSFLMVTLFGSAVIAGGLAAVQILPERSRDRWAALLHRPVSRSLIFAGKAAAGLGLYTVAVLLPFLACACYAAWPGKFAAPFVPGLLLPGLHTLASGPGFYFGVMLLCLYEGRWLGTRGALLVALGTVFVMQKEVAGPLLRLPLLAAAGLFLAAWHAMLGGTDAAPRGRFLRRGAFVAAVLLGAQSVLMLVGAGLNLLPKSENAAQSGYTQLEVTPEGRVLKARSSLSGEELTVTDLEGHPVTDERYLGNNNYQNVCRFAPLSFALGAERRGAFLSPADSLRGINYVQGVRLGNNSRESWYHLVRRNYFIGYDNLSRRCIGTCDREGFKAPTAKPMPFPGPLRASFLGVRGISWFWTDHRLYAISFADREMKPSWDRPDGTIEEMMEITPDRSAETFGFVVLALNNGIQVLGEGSRPVFARPYLHDPRRWDYVEVAANPAMDRLYFLSQPGFYNTDPERASSLTYLDELDLHGNVLHSYSQAIDNTVTPDPGWLRLTQACLLPLAPAVLEHMHSKFVRSPWSDTNLSFEASVAMLDRTAWSGMVLLGVVLAGSVFVCARRVGFSVRRAGGWAIFVLAFGPAGALAFRLAGGWPQRVRCPACGHRRSLGEDTCPHCRQVWEAPQPTGTEIFQPLGVQG